MIRHAPDGYNFVAGQPTDAETLPDYAPALGFFDELFDAPGESRVDTHAWVEALLPVPDGGEPRWVGADPTNRKLAGDQHVRIGHGRFYGDVPPIKGVYKGAPGEAEHDVNVRMTRV